MSRRTQQPSARLLRAAAIFSIAITPHATTSARRDLLRRATIQARELVGTAISPRIGLVLIHGPSGSGKSTLLAAAASELRRQRAHISILRPAADLPLRPLTDLSSQPLACWLRTLASCGLAEASLLTRTPRQLSAGQAWRLALALSLARISGRTPRRPRRRALLIDELGSGLDLITARGVCRALRRAASAHPDLLVLCATANPEALRDPLAPALELAVT